MNIRRAIQNALLAGEPNPSLWMEFARLGVRVQGSHRPPDDSIVLALERGAVLAAIDSLPEHMAAWLRFTYGRCDPSDRDIVARYAVRAVDAERSERLAALAVTAVEDCNLRISSQGARKFPVELYLHRLGVSEQAFMRTWKPRRNLILDKINIVDDQGVNMVWAKIRKKVKKTS